MSAADLATSEHARLHAGVGELDALVRDCIRAYAPPNVQYERERIIAMTPNAREWAFVLGLLSEGENEAVLLLDLMSRELRRDPAAPVAHLLDEAWYYLRTSIDPEWQLDDGEPSVAAALAYLTAVLGERLAILRSREPSPPLAATQDAGREARLRSLRAEFSTPNA